MDRNNQPTKRKITRRTYTQQGQTIGGFGPAIIFSHSAFEGTTGVRWGTSEDEVALVKAFTTLGVPLIKIYRNKRLAEIKNILKEASEDDYSNYKCVFGKELKRHTSIKCT